MTSRDLFAAILSLDSYNRNYGQNVILNDGDSTTNQDEAGRQLGNATILNIDIPENSVATGFYAIAYDVSGVRGFADGERVISYRGTNANFTASGGEDFLARPGVIDAVNGWIVGAGVPGGQANLAIDFYRAVVGDGNDPFNANITTTGHSLKASSLRIPTAKACHAARLAAANDLDFEWRMAG